jgi:glycosyltransferase involved in cell wall biosynthesis
VIGGKGDYLAKLKNKVNKSGLSDNIEFTGFLSEEEKADLLRRAWIFVTMAEKEGWGITVIEANAAGTPAVGSDVPGLQDSIKDGVTGYLVPLGNEKILAETIKKLIQNKDHLKKLSSNALDWSTNFSWDKSAEYFLEKVAEWYPSLKTKIKTE